MDWPRIPLPRLAYPWERGHLARVQRRRKPWPTPLHADANWPPCLTPILPFPAVTTGPLRPDIATIAVPATVDGRNMAGDDFALTAGWGHYGTGEAVMPGQGRVVEREYTADERARAGRGDRPVAPTRQHDLRRVPER